MKTKAFKKYSLQTFPQTREFCTCKIQSTSISVTIIIIITIFPFLALGHPQQCLCVLSRAALGLPLSFIKTLSLSKNFNTTAHQFINENGTAVFSASMFTSGHAEFHNFDIVRMRGGSDCVTASQTSVQTSVQKCQTSVQTKCEM